MEVHLLLVRLKVWLSFSFFITPGKYDWFSYIHMQNAINMVPSMPHSEKKNKNSKDLTFSAAAKIMQM